MWDFALNWHRSLILSTPKLSLHETSVGENMYPSQHCACAHTLIYTPSVLDKSDLWSHQESTPTWRHLNRSTQTSLHWSICLSCACLLTVCKKIRLRRSAWVEIPRFQSLVYMYCGALVDICGNCRDVLELCLSSNGDQHVFWLLWACISLNYEVCY